MQDEKSLLSKNLIVEGIKYFLGRVVEKSVQNQETFVLDLEGWVGILRQGSVQFSRSVVFASLWPMNCSKPGSPVHHQLPEPTQTHVHWVGDAIWPSYPLSSPLPLALNLSQHQGLFQWASSSHQVAKVWSFSISPSNEYSWLISFRIDWLDLLAVQGTLKSLL